MVEPSSHMVTKIEIAADWLTRYTGMPLDRFGRYVLLTNFRDYVQRATSTAIIARCRPRRTTAA